MRKLASLAAALASVALTAGRHGATVPHPPDPLRRSIPPAGASISWRYGCEKARRPARADDRDRQPARRRRNARDGARGEKHARRLHPPGRAVIGLAIAMRITASSTTISAGLRAISKIGFGTVVMVVPPSLGVGS